MFAEALSRGAKLLFRMKARKKHEEQREATLARTETINSNIVKLDHASCEYMILCLYRYTYLWLRFGAVI